MADGTRRASRARRTVVVAVAAWLAVVVVASVLAWFAIGRAGSEVLDPSAQQVPTPASSDPAATTSSTTAPPSTDPPTSGPATSGPATSGPATSGPATSGPATSASPTSSAPSAATAVEEVSTVAGGQAQFRCTGDVLTVPFAQPATGWSVSKDFSDGGARARVEFESSQGRFRIEAVCAGGEPSVTVESDDSGGGGGGGDD